MPILKNAKTVWVNENPWESPDGKVTIWQIKLEVDGERDTHNTMSKAVATLGFEGDVEVYTNAKGKDYVRQAPKEDGHPSGETSFKADPVKQDNIHRSVALEQARERHDLKSSDEDVLQTADKFYAWLKGETPSTDEPEQPQSKVADRQKVDKVFSDGGPLPDYIDDQGEGNGQY